MQQFRQILEQAGMVIEEGDTVYLFLTETGWVATDGIAVIHETDTGILWDEVFRVLNLQIGIDVIVWEVGRCIVLLSTSNPVNIKEVET